MKALRGLVVAGAVAALVQGVGAVASSPLADAMNGTMVATTAVNVRPDPNTTRARVGILWPGESVAATGSSNGWTTINFNGRTAYVSTQYLRSAGQAQPSPGTNQGTTGNVFTTASLNLRTGAGTNHASRAVVPRGAPLALTGTISGDWAQVVHGGETLWASRAYLTETAPSTDVLPAVTGKGRATARLMIRTTSGTDFRSLNVVPIGTQLDTTGVVTNGMAQVIYQSNLRWVNNKFLERVAGSTGPVAPELPPTTTRYATANLNIWVAATGEATVGLINKGNTVQVTGTVTAGRAQIVHDGVLRWVTSQYTSTAPPAASPGPGSGGGSGNINWNQGGSSGLERTNEFVQRIALDVWERWPAIRTQYGWRRDVTPDHPAGRALDVMVPNWRQDSGKALGKEIAEYYRANAREYNVHYVIWDQKIWNINRDREGWRHMADRGNNTANHLDHVHITTFDN